MKVPISGIVLMCIVLSFAFCDNPFATRKPEPPSENRSTWLQPIFPDRVITNLKFAIVEANVLNYMKCLTDSISRFRFTPDDFVSRNNQGFFDRWDLSSEQNYITKVFTATYDSVRNLKFSPVQPIDYQDSVLVKIDYELEVHHNLGDNYPQVVTGQADFWLNNSNGEWYITSWIDQGTENNPSWSSLKVIFGK